MKNIIYIKAKIKSISPLNIGNDDGEVLIDHESNMAYLPATSIAGSFRSYLRTIDENYISLFGCQEGKKSIMSSIYISDSFSDIKNLEKRDGLKIDDAMGSNIPGAKMEKIYLGEGLEFNLIFEIHAEEDKALSYKNMIYKCLNALNKNHIRFGGGKSSGLGNFKLISAVETEFNLDNFKDYKNYLKRNYDAAKDIQHEIFHAELEKIFVEFTIRGEFTTPLIIKAPDRFELNMADDYSLKSGDEYIVPGSSFKGVLRARVEKIASYFGNKNIAEEMFGTIIGNKKQNRLSRVMVSESKIDNKEYQKQIRYNRIKVDSFTGGVRKNALMNDVPIKGKTEFKIIYKRCKDNELDSYAIGILSLALRDLGTENLTLGGGNSIGRGRFKASHMCIADGDSIIKIDFFSKKIDEEEKLQKYIAAAKAYKAEEGQNGKEA